MRGRIVLALVAAYADVARGVAAGTTELEKRTRLAGAERCESAKKR